MATYLRMDENMNQKDLEHIVSLVTQQVIAAMDKQNSSVCTENCDKVLIVGKNDTTIPNDLCRNSVIFDLEDYRTHKDISRYNKVIITKLTITQLSDIALGRTGDEASCAVVYALLSGVDVVMLEDALTFRRFADKGSKALYNLLEQYADTLHVFGVKTYRPTPKTLVPESKPAKFAQSKVEVPKGSAKPNVGSLITEIEARQLLAQGKTICLPSDAIITPLARDVFTHAGVEVIKD